MSAQKSQMDSQDGSNLDWIVYHKFNKNLKERFKFIDRILDWKTYSEDLTEQKDKFRRGNQW